MLRRTIVLALLVMFPVTAASGQLLFFDDQAEFEAFATDEGKIFKGLEDFEENNLPPGSVAAFPGLLEPGVPNGPFPDGLTGVSNMSVEAIDDNGDGANDLVLLTDGFAGAQTSVVGANSFGDSTSLNMLDGDKTAVGFDAVILAAGNGLLDISVFDVAVLPLGTVEWVSGASPTFFGVFSDMPIGSINVAAQLEGGELLDNIQLWAVPEPGTLGLFGLGVLALVRRRR